MNGIWKSAGKVRPLRVLHMRINQLVFGPILFLVFEKTMTLIDTLVFSHLFGTANLITVNT
jgi:hypothetical protein